MIKKPKPVYRFLRFLVNLLSIVVIALFFDGVIVAPIAKTTNLYKNHYQEYNSLKVEFKNYQDLYGLYTYDENGYRIQVKDADVTAFNNDPRVKEIVSLAKKDEKALAKINLVTFSISYVLATAFVCVLVPLISKKNQDLGGLAFHIVLTKDGEMMVKKKSIGYAAINAGMQFILGLATLFVFDLVDFLFAVFSKNKNSLLETMFKYQYSIDLELVESEIPSEEKKYEDDRSHDDQSPNDIIKF